MPLRTWPNVPLVPPKAKGKRGREPVKPLSGLDVDALLGHTKRTELSAGNAIPEFKRAIAKTDDEGAVEDLVSQMGRLVHQLVRTSTGDSGYARAAEHMRVLRAQLVDFEMPHLYNAFVRDLKAKIAGGALGGPRLEMWIAVREAQLGLVTLQESDESKVTLDEADQVCASFFFPARLGLGVRANETRAVPAVGAEEVRGCHGDGLREECEGVYCMRCPSVSARTGNGGASRSGWES